MDLHQKILSTFNNTTNTRINSYYYPEVINKPDLILPPDWFECLDPESGKLYYACSKSKTLPFTSLYLIGTRCLNGIPVGTSHMKKYRNKILD